ncbi:type II secretion system protein GspM [Sphingomonas baiyangensis]|uniref:Type II secretion system protein M n=1 Tax=Sphingomonas baiyangensis TaxID=2572576 RepID=A0A4U1L9K4_9SPHN|nr:type II secretion system protein M [Sphingomonas baiyangensis]TKD53115.1 type II secretion system protein M [Sphingomonas baiyangensis]
MRVIRIIERDRIEAALARLDAWWSGLTRRERILVGTLSALLFAVVLVYGVVRPVQDARGEARADIRTYETLIARVRAAGTLGAQAPRRTGTPDQIVAGAAQQFGLAVTTAPEGAGVRATLVEGQYDAVVNWLAEVSRSSALGIVRAEIVRRPTPGMVAATVDFAP